MIEYFVKCVILLRFRLLTSHNVGGRRISVKRRWNDLLKGETVLPGRVGGGGDLSAKR
jgi:hypothetical protein